MGMYLYVFDNIVMSTDPGYAIGNFTILCVLLRFDGLAKLVKLLVLLALLLLSLASSSKLSGIANMDWLTASFRFFAGIVVHWLYRYRG